ncbi:MAG TPA: CAP domain-containing protein [Blastocatellia bacterium]|nr:CAP domain-containing protein [Blastocatellia bacterium]
MSLFSISLRARGLSSLVFVINCLLILSLSLFTNASAQSQPTLDSEEQQFLTLINNYRAQNGLGPLQVSATLTNASKWFSQDMAAKNYFPSNHVDSLGRDPFVRMAAFGYNYQTAKGENIAAGNATAAATFDQWKNSSGHNANMLSGSYKAIGIGRAYDANSTYRWYWTTDFGGYVDQPVTPPAGVTLTYNGKARDRVGQGNTAFSGDGQADGVFTASFQTGTGSRTVTSLQLSQQQRNGQWDTSPATGYWALGAAANPDGVLYNAGTGPVNFTVGDGVSFTIFASDYNNTMFVAGSTLTLTVGFSDGSTSSASLTIPATMTLSYNGKVRDRVGQGNTALASDGRPDGVFTASFPAGGGSRTVTSLQLSQQQQNGQWDTSPATGYWALGAAANPDGVFYNAGTGTVNFTVADGVSFTIFASDYNNLMFAGGSTLTLTVGFSDGTKTTAALTL